VINHATTRLSGVRFKDAWKRKSQVNYGKVKARIIGKEGLKKNFKPQEIKIEWAWEMVVEAIDLKGTPEKLKFKKGLKIKSRQEFLKNKEIS